MQIEYLKIEELIAADYNPRKISKLELEKLTASIRTHGFVEPIVVNFDNTIIGGHQRVKAAIPLGMDEVPAIRINVPKDQERALNVALNRIAGEFDEEKLALLVQKLNEEMRQQTGLDADEIEKLLAKEVEKTEKTAFLRDRFLVPPFSVLDARQGYWQDRKRKWLALGIRSELGRNEGLLMASASGNDPTFYIQKKEIEKKLGRKLETAEFETHYYEKGKNAMGTSVFDPVLCELAYRWFSPAAGSVLDPFAGGSVRGVVAALTGREYVGIELRPEQVEANRKQWGGFESIDHADQPPRWVQGDSRNADTLAKGEYDFIFSCPPYANLEEYSDDPNDLSNMDYADFLIAYREIIAKACGLLKENRFAVFVVGDVRAPDGMYRNFVSHTIQAFEDAGLRLYNEAAYVTPSGSLSIRAGKQMEFSRKLGKTHQNVLVLVKGDPETAVREAGPAFEETRMLGEQHEKVLVFSKGDPEKATKEIGEIEIDDDAFVQNPDPSL